MIFDVNTDAAVRLSNKLEELRKSALPIAVRGTLNKAALDVKTRTMPMSADRHFIKRKPNFFIANSRAVLATGFDVNAMKSLIGFTPSNPRAATNFAVRELDEQEHGGVISHRTFIPMDSSRVGGSPRQLVKPGLRLSNINTIANSNDNTGGRSSKEKFIRTAIFAGKGGFVIGDKALYRVTGISRGKNRKTKIKTQPIYFFKKGRSVGISSTHFMREATDSSASRLNKFFVEEADRQFKRVLNK